MALTARLELRTQQRLSLTPSLRMRLSILRMGPLDLAEEIAREAARNPFLLYDSPRRHSADVQWADADIPAHSLGFQEDLRQQLGRLPLEPRIAALAEFLVAELREDGFLDTDLATLAEELSLPLALLERALAALQGCEPAGIGARTLPECLRLQLVAKGLTSTEAEATVAQLAAFARRDWAALGVALGLDRAALRARADLLRGLSSRPVPERPALAETPLRPDLRLERHSGNALRIITEGATRPQLHLDPALVRRAQADGFAPELLQRAKALIEALDHRGRTLARIGDWLVQNQDLFFARGLEGLVPTSRVALAADLALHPSTISRAISGKAIDVDGRLWPLSIFFSAALPGPKGPVSARAVQRRLADLISCEPDARPWSDETLVEKLNAEGIDIARRTVTKYRQGLRIPSSAARRRLAAAKCAARRDE